MISIGDIVIVLFCYNIYVFKYLFCFTRAHCSFAGHVINLKCYVVTGLSFLIPVLYCLNSRYVLFFSICMLLIKRF